MTLQRSPVILIVKLLSVISNSPLKFSLRLGLASVPGVESVEPGAGAEPLVPGVGAGPGAWLVPGAGAGSDVPVVGACAGAIPGAGATSPVLRLGVFSSGTGELGSTFTGVIGEASASGLTEIILSEAIGTLISSCTGVPSSTGVFGHVGVN